MKKEMIIIRVSKAQKVRIKEMAGKNVSKFILGKVLTEASYPTSEEVKKGTVVLDISNGKALDVDVPVAEIPVTPPVTLESVAESEFQLKVDEANKKAIEDFKKEHLVTAPVMMPMIKSEVKILEKETVMPAPQPATKVIEPVALGPIPINKFVKGGVMEPSEVPIIKAPVLFKQKVEETVIGINAPVESVTACVICGNLYAKLYPRSTGKSFWLCDDHKP